MVIKHHSHKVWESQKYQVRANKMQIAGVVAVGSGVGMLPPQVLLKFFDFGEHFTS